MKTSRGIAGAVHEELLRAERDAPEGLALSECADLVASLAVRMHAGTIVVTGPSAVGKTWIASRIGDGISLRGVSVCTIPVDWFLRVDLRGKRQYRAESERPLRPSDYDFRLLMECHASLRSGKAAELAAYSRGRGWQGRVVLHPSDCLLLEGLFLDSGEASATLDYDLGLRLEADPVSIRRWREEREASLRAEGGGYVRSWVESMDEADRTLAAHAGYERARDLRRMVTLRVGLSRRVSCVSLDSM